MLSNIDLQDYVESYCMQDGGPGISKFWRLGDGLIMVRDLDYEWDIYFDPDAWGLAEHAPWDEGSSHPPALQSYPIRVITLSVYDLESVDRAFAMTKKFFVPKQLPTRRRWKNVGFYDEPDQLHLRRLPL